MPPLSIASLVRTRVEVAEAKLQRVTWTKAQIHVAIQAIDDWFSGQRPAIASAIETASPGLFSPAEKRLLVIAWLRERLGLE